MHLRIHDRTSSRLRHGPLQTARRQYQASPSAERSIEKVTTRQHLRILQRLLLPASSRCAALANKLSVPNGNHARCREGQNITPETAGLALVSGNDAIDINASSAAQSRCTA